MLAHVDDVAHAHPHPEGVPVEVIVLLALVLVGLLSAAVVAWRSRNAD